MRPRPSVVAALAGVVIAALGACSDAGREADRQKRVADRGRLVMPFSLEETTHVFTPDGDGGVQSVVADDPEDRDQVGLIRGHLRKEAKAFRAGDFDDPAHIHGDDMPGLATLRERYESLEVEYSDLDEGAQIRYRGDDREVVKALHLWFEAQVSDHGAHAKHGG